MSFIVAALIALGATAPIQPTPSAVSSLRAMATWTLVLDKDASPSERYAAEEFARLFKEATGAELKPQAVPGKAGNIFIGAGSAMRAHAFGFGVEPLGEEGLRIRINPDCVLIAGGRPRGTLYGVYEFFERYLGVRFLTKDDTYLPKGMADTPLPQADYQYVPPFNFRWSYYGENSADPAFAARLRVNTVATDEKLGGKTPQGLISHSVAEYVPTAVYGKDHPEYFALVGGVRRLNVKGGGPQLCSTNPEVISIVTKAVLDKLDKEPSTKMISVSQMDNDEYCHCPACKALSEKEDSNMAPHLALVNAVAEQVEKKHPGVMVGTLAYSYTRKPPKTIVARPNVQIMLCSIECCTLHALNDPTCSGNRFFCSDLQGWKNKSDNIFIWNYNTNFRGYDLPFPNFNAIARNVQFFLDNHVRGVFMQAAGNAQTAEMSDLRNYVMARCLWRPTEDAWYLVDEFCRLHYGPAAPVILEYERFLHAHAEANEVHPGCFPTEGEVGLDAPTAQRLLSYMEEALKLALNDVIRQRVEKATIPALRAVVATTPFVCKDGIYKLDPCTGTTIDRYMDYAKRYGMTHVGEETPAANYYAQLDTLRKGVPAVRIENKVWRVVLLPENNARIVEMTYKKTGRNLVAAPTRGFDRWHSHEEWLQDGRPAVDHIVFACEATPRSAKLTRTLPDGSTIVRHVSLASDSAKTIDFHSEFLAGAPQAGQVIHVHPEYFSVSNSKDPNVIALYAKVPEWTHVNKNWQWNLDTQPTPFDRITGGAYAYYNHAEHFGVVQTFDPKDFARQEMYWSPGRKQVDLEMFTPVTTMAKGDVLKYDYKIGYLTEPPMRAK